MSAGDRQPAARATTIALAAGARDVEAHAHPERAGAWLRARVLRELARRRSTPRPTEAERSAALRSLGATPEAILALRALPFDERAALVSACVERFEPIDVETIVGRPRGSTQRIVASARRRYLEAVQRAGRPRSSAASSAAPGLLARRIGAVAARALGTGTMGARR